ncbi:MAG: YfhO family protein [Firmicutes bacterium]|nr:YfhO family protein [Bacillota bacterium]
MCTNKGKALSHFLVLMLFLFIASAVFYRFILLKQNHIAADFTNWYYPWRFYLVQDNNYNSYISNKNLGDPLFMFSPVDKKYNEEIKKGRIPLWNDSALMGFPAYASHTASFFYPPKIIANYFFDFLNARDVLCIFHLFLIASALYFYLYGLGLSQYASFTGGIIWMLCGFVACRMEFGTDIFPLAYLPFLLLLTDKIICAKKPAYAPLLSVIACLCFMSGHWQFVFYVFLMWGAYSLFRIAGQWKLHQKAPVRESLILAVSGFLGFTLSAVQSLPIIELTKLSARPEATGMNQAFSVSRFLPENLLTLFVPEIFGNPIHHFYLTRISSGVQNYFELMVYIGILPLILAFISLTFGKTYTGERKFFGISSAVVLLMAMGTPLYAVLFYTMPFVKSFTPVRILCLFSFSMCVLAAIGFQQILDKSLKSDKFRFTGLAFTGISLAVAGFAIYNVSRETPLFAGLLELYWKSGVMDLPHNFADKKMFVYEMITGIKTHYNWNNLQLTAPVFIGMAATILLWVYNRLTDKKLLFTVLVAVIVVFDLFPVGQRFNPAFPGESIYPQSQGIRIMTSDKDLYRVSGWQRYPHPNTLSVYGINEVNGYYSMFPSSVRDLFFALNKGSLPSPILAVFEEKAYINPGLSALFNIRWFYNNPNGAPPPVPVRQVYNGDLAVFENLSYLPRAFMVGKIDFLPQEKIAEQMLKPDFNPLNSVLAEEDASSLKLKPAYGKSGSESKSEAEILMYSPGSIKIRVNSPAPAYLVLSDTYYPGWKAFQDGALHPIIKAYGFARAIPVDAGEHIITIGFQPESLKAGILISVISLILILAIFGYIRKEKVKSAENTAAGNEE